MNTKPIKKDETITIDKGKFENMMKRMERLEESASKARLQAFDDKHKEKGNKIVSLRMIDNKVILKWQMIKNIVEKTPNGNWSEDQQIEVEFEGGEKKKMPYVVFERRWTRLAMEVKKEIKDEDGHITFVGETANGKIYEILDTFIN